MKMLLVIDVDDELLEDYENFYVDYDLRAECKDEDVNRSIRYVEDCPLKPMPEKWVVEGVEEILPDLKKFSIGRNQCIDEILGEEK